EGELVSGEVGGAAEARLGGGVDPTAQLDQTLEGTLVGVVGQAPAVQEEEGDPRPRYPIECRTATNRGALPDEVLIWRRDSFALHRERKVTLRERSYDGQAPARSCLRSSSLRPPQMPWGSRISRA